MSNEVQSIEEARRIAREYAYAEDFNEVRAEAFADVWFDAGKDSDASTADALRAYIRRRFDAAN
ncbi:hypothetical protein [Paraburkholderia sp. J8-2]|uniref:hypothetical protein n=1 Tax=Paraburkholderia sp. J8-2 TaxID=2805440 RepID=UPI002AB6122F|nr:hypothetical protein [Paraburkholderia sp. J8-2]